MGRRGRGARQMAGDRLRATGVAYRRPALRVWQAVGLLAIMLAVAYLVMGFSSMGDESASGEIEWLTTAVGGLVAKELAGSAAGRRALEDWTHKTSSSDLFPADGHRELRGKADPPSPPPSPPPVPKCMDCEMRDQPPNHETNFRFHWLRICGTRPCQSRLGRLGLFTAWQIPLHAG